MRPVEIDGTKRDLENRNHVVRFELIDKHGRVHVETFDSAASAVQCARQIYPDQHRDEERKGLGWDIRVAGSR